MMESFKSHLERSGLSQNTVSSYMETVRFFLSRYGKVNPETLAEYKTWLIDNYKPKTVNLRLHAINRYLRYIRKESYILKGIKEGGKTSLENVIGKADYRFFKRRLKADGCDDGYFAVWFMAATGARISELLQMKAEHVFQGYVDLYSKGGKLRRIYFPKSLRKEAAKWLRKKGAESGYLFLNRSGKVITSRGMALKLERYARKYGIDPKLVHPHAFRHLFAKSFLEKCNDISFLADLLGHESIETTRIYLRRTSREQHEVLDRIVTW